VSQPPFPTNPPSLPPRSRRQKRRPGQEQAPTSPLYSRSCPSTTSIHSIHSTRAFFSPFVAYLCTRCSLAAHSSVSSRAAKQASKQASASFVPNPSFLAWQLPGIPRSTYLQRASNLQESLCHIHGYLFLSCEKAYLTHRIITLNCGAGGFGKVSNRDREKSETLRSPCFLGFCEGYCGGW